MFRPYIAVFSSSFSHNFNSACSNDSYLQHFVSMLWECIAFHMIAGIRSSSIRNQRPASDPMCSQLSRRTRCIITDEHSKIVILDTTSSRPPRKALVVKMYYTFFLLFPFCYLDPILTGLLSCLIIDGAGQKQPSQSLLS